MAATTFGHVQTLDTPVKVKGFAHRLLDRYIQAQMKKAQLRVNAYLQSLDDKSLEALGYTPADISNIRRSAAAISLIV